MTKDSFWQTQFLRQFMENNNLKQTDLAMRLEITRQYLNLFLNGNKPITEQLALKLEKITHIKAEHWVGSGDGIPNDELAGTIVERWQQLGGRTLVDLEIEEAIDAQYIVISPFEPEKLDPASYQLSLSSIVQLNHEENSIDMGEVGDITLQPGQEAIVMTEEELRIPKNIIGKLYRTTTSIDLNNLVISGGIVHPGYCGKIYFAIRNMTPSPVEISAGNPLIRVTFEFLPVAPTRVYSGTKQHLAVFPESLVENRAATRENSSSSQNPDGESVQLEQVTQTLEELLRILKKTN